MSLYRVLGQYLYLVSLLSCRTLASLPVVLLLGLLLFGTSCPDVEATVIYSYTGQNFTSATPPYTLDDKVTGSFAVADILQGEVQATQFKPNLLSFSFSDGVSTFDGSNSVFNHADFLANAAGNIVFWDFGLQQPLRLGNGISITSHGDTADAATTQGFAFGSAESSVPGSWSLGSVPGSHDQQVLATISTALQSAATKFPSGSLEDRAAIAFNSVVDMRKLNSADTVLRDAEYFLIGFKAMAGKSPSEIAFASLAPVYSAVKSLAFGTSTEGALQTVLQFLHLASSESLSPPGGGFWAWRGLYSGFTGVLAGVTPSEPVQSFQKNGSSQTLTLPIGVNGVGTTVPVHVDPDTGYSYHLMSATAHFQSVTLPPGTVPAGGHLLVRLNGQLYSIGSGETFNFLTHGSPNGTDDFSILGLDLGQGFDIQQGQQLVLGLTFTDSDPLVSITQTASTDLAATPEPTTLLLFGTTAAGLGLARWKRRSQK